MTDSPRYFLGFDSSTQSLKATLIDESLRVIHTEVVHFDSDLPEFATQGGAHHDADGQRVTSPTIMWVAALDLLLERMRKSEAPLGRVVAVSGSGQQHGSVWMNAGATAALSGLEPGRTLRDQLHGIFSVADSPIWMDSSTGAECEALEQALGGAQRVAELTGSRAFARFTGNQIAKIFRTDPDAYAATAHIALVSSFVASMLVGKVAPIDASDGSGMNLMDIRRKDWLREALDATAPDLADKLGNIVPSHTDVGALHAYYVTRYGFRADCRVVAFSGDNPCSLAGLRVAKSGDLAISLGTSDTLFGALAEPKPSATEGHIFANPVDPDGYMAMICRKNGSLTREQVRDAVAGRKWPAFVQLLAQTPPGNNGRMGIYVREPEITPPITRTGDFRFDAAGQPTERFTAAEDVRAVLENQFLTMRLHGENVGLKPTRLIATGGASVENAILRVVADVFGAPVYVAVQADSASLGAAYRALHGWQCYQRKAFVPFAGALLKATAFRKAVDPDAAAHAAYTDLLPRLDGLEKGLMRQG